MSVAILQISTDSNTKWEYQQMYLFVYKTTHKNGKYYIGRHQTKNLNDGYLGSGNWVKSIKNKKNLSKEILEFSDNIKNLKILEENYIRAEWGNPNCMNYTMSSGGFTSVESKNLARKRVELGEHHWQGPDHNNKLLGAGTHPFMTREDGTNAAQDRVREGTHPFMTRPDGTNLTQDRVIAGTHPFMTRPDGTNVAQDRVRAGTHNWQGPEHNNKLLDTGTHPFMTREDGSSLSSDRVKNGTHNFLTRPDGTSQTQEAVKNGTHNWVRQRGTVACYDINGNYIRVNKQIYDSQLGIMDNWEFVTITSKEGNRRKSLRS